jgi:hypothetical protein
MSILSRVGHHRSRAFIWLVLVPALTVCRADKISNVPNESEPGVRASDSVSFARRPRRAAAAAAADSVTSPGTVTDLSVTGTSSTSVTLTFTQVADGTGQPAHYDVRYAVAPISWGDGASVANGTCSTPVAGTAIGAKLSCTVLGLSPSTTYNFQLVAFRDTLNVNAKFGGLSNVVGATTPAGGPPGTVSDLNASATGPNSVTLSFTQVTDGMGQPAQYDVRYSVAPISWGQAASVTNGTCATPVAGTAISAKLSCTVLGLSSSRTYNFQVVAFRGTLNVNAKFGGLSNVAAASTAAVVTATQLAMLTQPSSGAQSGAPFAQQPTIQLRDASNQVVNQAGVSVTAGIAGGTNGTLSGVTTVATNTNGIAAFSNLAIAGGGTYTLGFSAPGLRSANSSPITVTTADTTPSSGGGEPTYNSATDKLILQDNFDGYSGILSGASPFTRRYTTYRALGLANQSVRLDSVVTLVPGRNGSGQAIRLAYGSPGGASDIIVGPETQLSSVGSWNGTLPQVAGPYSHFFFTTWIRFSPGADPASYNDSGVKGIMLWHTGNQRYEAPPHTLKDYNGGRYAQTRWDAGPPHPPNYTTGLNHWRTANGEAPIFAPFADGNWHRSTQEVYAADPSGHKGERWWLDGVLVFDNMDNVGDLHWGADYTYTNAITHWMVFGNYVTASTAAHSPFFTVDFDDWIAWTR